jgi:hypothetical protein
VNISRGVTQLGLLSVSDWIGIDPEVFILRRESNYSCNRFVVRRRSKSIKILKRSWSKGSYKTLQNARHFVVNSVRSQERSISHMLSLPMRLINVSLVVLCHLDLISI